MTTPFFTIASAPRPLIAAFGALLLSGCANFSADGGFVAVSDRVSNDLAIQPAKVTSEKEAEDIAARASALLAARPLTAEGAMQIALINNRALQAKYNELGLSETDLVEASTLANPTFAFSRISGDGAIEFEYRIAGNILGLFTLPTRKAIAGSQFKAAQYRTLDATLRLAGETRRAYYRAVAAAMRAQFLEQARTSAESMATLSRRLGETGAHSKLDQARSTGFFAEVSAQLVAARFTARREHESLVRMLGLWGEQAAFELPSNLPDLPATLDDLDDAEADAILQRADLIAAKHDLDATSRALGLTQATRFISLLEIAGISKSERGGGEIRRSKGFEIALQIPIFDLGEISQRRGRETYMKAVNDLTAKAIDIRSEARVGYYSYRAAFEVARQYEDLILPARKIVNDESVLRYNGMLIDVFELLTTAHEGIASTIAAIDARRDFFIAQSEFKSAQIGGMPPGSAGQE